MSEISTGKNLLSATADAFAKASDASQKPRRKRPAPLSIRITDEEREQLKRAAGGQPLNGYVRDQLFGASGKPARSRRRQPIKDHAALGQALALLGTMDVAPSLRTLATAAETGSLDITPECAEELRNACAAVIAIRTEILRALGYHDEVPD